MGLSSSGVSRIGYVGTLDAGGTCRARLDALSVLEASVVAFDVNSALAMRKLPRARRLLEYLPWGGPSIWSFNRRIVQFAAENEITILWVDKGSWIRPATLKVLKAMGIVLVHHVTDALWPRQLRLRLSRRNLVATAPLYDFYLTSNEVDKKRLEGRTSGIVLLTQLGFDDARFNRTPVEDRSLVEKWANDLLFIGHCEPRTERYIAALIRAGLPVKVFGAGWLEKARTSTIWKGRAFGPVSDVEYNAALKLTKIGLCFVSEWNYNQTAGRSYEIPACGTFLLAMRSAMHQAHFREGSEAEFFSSVDELATKAKFYLAEESRRKEVAMAGFRRCLQSGYSWHQIVARDWEAIQFQMRNRRQSRKK